MNNTNTKKRWVVSWIYNSEVRAEEFEFRLPAEIRMMQLESFGMKPTLHDRFISNDDILAEEINRVLGD